MRSRQRHRACAWSWIVTLVSLPFIGCERRQELQLRPVQGRITLDGLPLPRGSLTLRPDVAGGSWHQPTGMIEAEGKYTVYTNRREGAPEGNYRVVVFATESTSTPTGQARPGLPQSLIPSKYNSPEQTPLRVRVVEQPAAGAYDLELKSRDN